MTSQKKIADWVRLDEHVLESWNCGLHWCQKFECVLFAKGWHILSTYLYQTNDNTKFSSLTRVFEQMFVLWNCSGDIISEPPFHFFWSSFAGCKWTIRWTCWKSVNNYIITIATFSAENRYTDVVITEFVFVWFTAEYYVCVLVHDWLLPESCQSLEGGVSATYIYLYPCFLFDRVFIVPRKELGPL